MRDRQRLSQRNLCRPPWPPWYRSKVGLSPDRRSSLPMTRTDSAISVPRSASASRIGGGSRVLTAHPRIRLRLLRRCCSRVNASTCSSARLACAGDLYKCASRSLSRGRSYGPLERQFVRFSVSGFVRISRARWGRHPVGPDPIQQSVRFDRRGPRDPVGHICHVLKGHRPDQPTHQRLRKSNPAAS
jgi:hypothetical protein